MRYWPGNVSTEKRFFSTEFFKNKIGRNFGGKWIKNIANFYSFMKLLKLSGRIVNRGVFINLPGRGFKNK